MHGLSDNADNYLALFNNPEVTPLTPETKVILLTAPEREALDGEKKTSWFDFNIADWEAKNGNKGKVKYFSL